ncbi:MAG: cytochrome P450 [Alphaproteobacteria bacterium]|nr:cytochrome P450 [Alphaproteobacteria bacterium]
MASLRAPPPLPAIPAPRELPVLGSLVPFARDPLAFLRRMHARHGDLVQIRLVNHRLVMVSDPELLETVLVGEWRNLHKDAIYELTRPLLGNGLVTAEGEEWKRNRRLAAPSFTPRHIARYAETMQACVDDWIAGIRAGTDIDLFHEMMELTQTIVLKTLFGDVSVDVSGAGAAIETVMNEFIAEVQGHRRLWPEGFPSRGRRRVARAIALLDDLIERIIAARRAKGLGDDLFSQLLAARDDDGVGMSDRQLRDEAVTMFAAGHETTATALTYTFLLLATHPDEDRRLAADPERATPVLQESLRLMPPVWAIGRETQATVDLGGHAIPAGIQLLVPMCVLHRDPRWFAEPDAFRPDRWVDPPERPRFAYIPFGGGPRVCIGNHFAMMEGAIALKSIAPRFRFEALGPVPPPAIPSITLRPKGAVPVRVHAR